MELVNGGRITLRRVSESADPVEYDGELATVDARYRVAASVALADGKVSFRAEGAEAPEWLLEIARTTLRSAWHGHRAGVAWPRRLTRWRESASD